MKCDEKRNSCYFDESGSVRGTISVENVATLKDETECEQWKLLSRGCREKL